MWTTKTEDTKQCEGDEKAGREKQKQKMGKEDKPRGGGNNQLTDYTMWRRTNGLQYEEERKEEDQLKDDGV